MQRILLDSTESLLIYPPEDVAGQASSARVRVGTPSTSLPDEDTWDAATVDTSVSASTSAASSRGADTLTFASDPVCTVDRRHLLELAAGQRVFVTPIATGTTVTLADPLPMDIPSGTPLKSYVITHPLTATETDLEGRGLAIVEATIAGVVHRWRHEFRIVRHRFAAPFTWDDFVRGRSFFDALKPSKDEDGSESIWGAWEDELLPHLRGRGMEENRIVSAGDLKAVWMAALRLYLLRDARSGSEELATAERDFAQKLDLALRSSEFWYAAPATDALSQGRDDPNEFTEVRLTR